LKAIVVYRKTILYVNPIIDKNTIWCGPLQREYIRTVRIEISKFSAGVNVDNDWKSIKRQAAEVILIM